MKPEKDTPESGASEAEAQVHPLEVMRQAYRAMEITFQEDDGSIFTRLNLKSLEVHVISFGEPDDLATIIVRLPVRAAPEFRAQAGEFLHRLNFNARRKLWEFDHNDGVRMEWRELKAVLGWFSTPTFRCGKGPISCLGFVMRR